jgi:hypothetical protein
VDFVARDGNGGRRLLSLAWCEKWEPVGEDWNQQDAGTPTNNTGRQWVCRQKHNPGQWIWYVPCPDDTRTIHTGGSTRIRDIIANCPSEQLLERLEGKAMNPDMLVEFVMEARTPDIYRVFGVSWYYVLAGLWLGCVLLAMVVSVKAIRCLNR